MPRLSDPVPDLCPDCGAATDTCAAFGCGTNYETPPDCPECGGLGTMMGRLGTLTWYRCRQCGVEWPAEPEL